MWHCHMARLVLNLYCKTEEWNRTRIMEKSMLLSMVHLSLYEAHPVP